MRLAKHSSFGPSGLSSARSSCQLRGVDNLYAQASSPQLEPELDAPNWGYLLGFPKLGIASLILSVSQMP
jgi:hypothetical protein